MKSIITGHAINFEEDDLNNLSTYKRLFSSYKINEDKVQFSIDYLDDEGCDYIQDGDLQYFLKANYHELLDLRYFHDAKFFININLSEPKSTSFILSPSTIAMCAALGAEIEIHEKW